MVAARVGVVERIPHLVPDLDVLHTDGRRMTVPAAQPGEVSGGRGGVEAERGGRPARIGRRGRGRVQVLDLVHELLVAGVDVEDVDEPAVQPFEPVGDDVDTMFSALCPQWLGICRPPEFGSTAAPTAE